jgi:hypothetical protein
MTLRKALADVMQLEAIARNPTEGMRLPGIPHTETHWYSNAQPAKLFKAT